MCKISMAPVISRRSAIAGMGVGALGLALATTAGSVSAQEATPAAVRFERDVVYGEIDGQQLLLDVALPADRADLRPAVVVIHGGWFVLGDRSFLADPLPPLAAAGYVVFNIEYRLFGDDGSNPWPAQLVDAQRAVRWIRANAAIYGIDPDRVAAYGHSAGGTLAAHLGTRDTLDNSDPVLAAFSSRVTCVLDIARITDSMIPWTDPDDTARLVAFLGGTPDDVPEAYDDFSVLTHVNAESVPFLILHGTRDTFVPIEHSRRLAEALRETEVEVVFGEFANIDHLDWDWAKAGPWALSFFGRHLHS
jgi:acetyl esterase/lipase